MAVKTYSFKKQGNLNVSEHTKVREMASTQGSKLFSDKVLVDENLMVLVEKLFKKLRCSQYLISSGYRTKEHDKAVGGNGSGQHTKGKAIDCCFCDKNKKPIPAKIVSCVAQDMGFNGIARISDNYIHLDTGNRTIKYMGDETVGNNSVTRDFYKYYHLTKSDIAKYTGEKVETSTVTSKKSNKEIAKEVVAGKWGNGDERKKKLKAAGYDYSAIQKEVNKLLKG